MKPKIIKKILVITDNFILYTKIKEILQTDFADLLPMFDFKRSMMGLKPKIYANGIDDLEEINIKEDYPIILATYQLVISLHCKQIFPSELVENTLCINIHPGYNPYNRGWYPQVFAIVNDTVLGATIHVMDKQIDSGLIIDRRKVKIESWHTSKEAYENVLEAELQLFRKNIQNIVNGDFQKITPEIEGKYHSVQDYKQLCKLDLEENLTMKQAIDRLRALSHDGYKNAYFYDNDGNKIFAKIELNRHINE